MSLFLKNLVLKKLTITKKSSGGKNFYGRTSVYHRELGHKKKYRFIDFFRIIREVPGKVRRLEYDPNRSAFVALVCYKNSVLAYCIAAEGLKVGSIVISGVSNSYSIGSSSLISNVPIGSYVFNLEYFPGFGGKVSRAAGSFCQILKKFNEKYILVRMKSKEFRIFYQHNFVTYGVVSNSFKKFEKFYKAGQSRWRGVRPIVRGEAKNPVDHPHGGNTSGGRHPVTPWGKLTRGVRTRRLRNSNIGFIVKSRYK